MLNSFAELALVDALGWSLLHSLWQGLAVGAIAAAFLAVLPSSRPRARFAVAYTGLVLMLLLPAGTCVWLATTNDSQATRPNAAAEHARGAAIRPADNPPTNQRPEPDRATRGNAATPALQNPQSAIRNLKSEIPSIPWPAAAVLTWVVGLIISAARLVKHLREIRCDWLGQSVKAPQPWQRRLDAWAQRVGVTCRVWLLQSTRVDVPMTIGWLRPVIIVPAGLLVGMPPHELENILVHELVHIRRHDYLLNLIQVILQRLLFYHPAAWWVGNRINVERECCCDRAAADITGSVNRYAGALLALEEQRQAAARLVLAATGANLTLRIERLTGTLETGRAHVATLRWMCIGAVLVAATWISLRFLPESSPSSSGSTPEIPVFPRTPAPRPLAALNIGTAERPVIQLGPGQSVLVECQMPNERRGHHVWVRVPKGPLHLKVFPDDRDFDPIVYSRWTDENGVEHEDSAGLQRDVGYADQLIGSVDANHDVWLDVRRSYDPAIDPVPASGPEKYRLWLWCPGSEDAEPNEIGLGAKTFRLDEWGYGYVGTNSTQRHLTLFQLHRPDIDAFQVRARWDQPISFMASGRASKVPTDLHIFDENFNHVTTGRGNHKDYVTRVTIPAKSGEHYYFVVTPTEPAGHGGYLLSVDQIQGNDQ